MATLYVVSTPIGNLEDLSRRAERVLREVPLVAAEDTRLTRRLLTRIGSGARLVSYREANHAKATEHLLRHLTDADAALVTDAGTPAVSDPGRRLVAAVRAAGFAVAGVPGPSAVTAALAVAGLWADRWTFVGFLPNRAAARRAELLRWAASEDTVVAYEAPHRLRETLAAMADLLPERRLALARELTKAYEEVRIGSAAQLLAGTPEDVRGEIVLIIEGGPASARQPAPVKAGRSRLAALAQELGVERRVLYRFLVEQRQTARNEAGD